MPVCFKGIGSPYQKNDREYMPFQLLYCHTASFKQVAGKNIITNHQNQNGCQPGYCATDSFIEGINKIDVGIQKFQISLFVAI
jgi:hypothetical protein